MNRILKTILSLLTGALMLTCAALPVFADAEDTAQEQAVTEEQTSDDAQENADYKLVFDDAELVTDYNEEDLEELLLKLSEENDLAVAIHTTNSTGDLDIESYAEKYYAEKGIGAKFGDDAPGVFFVLDMGGAKCSITAFGSAESYFDDSGVENIIQYLLPDLNSGMYTQAMKKYIPIIERYIMQGKLGAPYQDEKRVVDRAEIIPDEDEKKLLEKCDEISEKHKFEVVIATVNSLGTRTSTEYADDYYDYSGFGLDDERSGILLLISMEDRDWAISTTGNGIPYFTDKGQEYMVSEFKRYLSKGEYYRAFDLYADLCEMFIEEAEGGSPYDVNHLPEHSLRPFREVVFKYLMVVLPISLLAAFLLWLIICTIEKKKLTSVSLAGQADDYIVKDSLNISKRKDTFLYKHTTKRYNPPSESSGGGGGGSSSHSSSSGSSHGGSSGHF